MYELFIEQIGSDVFVTTQQLHNIFFYSAGPCSQHRDHRRIRLLAKLVIIHSVICVCSNRASNLRCNILKHKSSRTKVLNFTNSNQFSSNWQAPELVN